MLYFSFMHIVLTTASLISITLIIVSTEKKPTYVEAKILKGE